VSKIDNRPKETLVSIDEPHHTRTPSQRNHTPLQIDVNSQLKLLLRIQPQQELSPEVKQPPISVISIEGFN
jgi:hypothetical protein